MRILKIILALVIAAVAVAAGVFVVALIAALALVFLIVRWATRRFGKPLPESRARKSAAPGDVIDVSATEVREKGLKD